MKKISLNQIFTLSLALLMLSVISGLSWFFYHQEKSMLLGELQRHGLALAENLAYNAEYSLLFRDVDVLEKLVDGMVQDRDVLFALIVDTDNELMVEKALSSYPKHQENVRERVEEILTFSPNVPFTEHHDEEVYYIFIPILVPTLEDETFGTLNGEHSGPDIRAMTSPQREISGIAMVGISFERVTESLREIQRQVLQLALFVMVLAVIVARLLLNTISRPIRKLAEGTHRIARGELSREVQIAFPREIGELAEAFNQMMHDLSSSRKELERWTGTLENRVQERTQEIEQKNQRLTELVEKMKKIQEQLVHSEKMASLGQLVAGIAHEINNPVNFISSNVRPLKGYISDMKSLILEYERQSDASSEAFECIKRLKSEIEFDFLVDDLDDLIEDVENGAIRIKRIVQDLRNFSRLDEAELKTIDIHESLDTTLNLLGHIYGNRIVVHKEYGNIPAVECYAGQLNQVFMNLLANAGQAIPRAGKVWIETSCDESSLCIAIRDDGKGIPEEALPKIFDPFFTTKDVGEGTGLGLSISYGIIEKHQGEIMVESEPGKGTQFSLKIPLKLSAE
ncbi:MAG: HAMP domain-containing protein [bacterium]|nr:HAMP domain-containing protein [bacterium]